MKPIDYQVVYEQGMGNVETIVESESDTEMLFKFIISSRNDTTLAKILVQLNLVNGKDFRIFKEGFQSWSVCRSFASNEKDRNQFNPRVTQTVLKHDLSPAQLYNHKHGYGVSQTDSNPPAYYWTAVKYADGEICLVGAVTFYKYMTKISCDDLTRKLIIELDFDNALVKAGERVTSETLYIYRGYGQDLDVINRYAGLVAEKMKVVIDKHIPVGWCSWYYFFTDVHEDDIYRNVAALQKKDYPVEIVLIDDGYEREIGDWLELNDKFAKGLKSLAGYIKASGFKPGIWVAPFIVGKNSVIYRKHPDWVLRNNLSQNEVVLYGWNQKVYALDLTQQEVLEYLRHVFDVMANDWGMEYFKLDFLFAGMAKGIRSSSRITPVESYRNALKLIREAVGKEKFIVGCGAPLGPSVGLVDGMRIGPDVAPKWADEDRTAPAAENAIRNILNRSFYHGIWWINDPDCLLVRDARTELDINEIISLATAIKLSGGALFYSDDLSNISKNREEIIGKMGLPFGNSNITLDIFEKPIPQLYAAKLNNQIYLGVFNFTNEPVIKEIRLSNLKIDPSEYCLYDFWAERNLGRAEEPIIIKLERHASKLLVLSKFQGNSR